MCMIGDYRGQGTGPLLGWRGWKVSPRGWLKPLFNGGLSDLKRSQRGFDKASGQPRDCTSDGFWFFLSRRHVTSFAFFSSQVYGQAVGCGVLSIHQLGFRAEYIGITGPIFYDPSMCPDLLKLLKQHYPKVEFLKAFTEE